MQSGRRTAFLLAIVVTAVSMPEALRATESAKNDPKQDIWQDEPKQPRSWWTRGLSDDTIDRAMKALRKRDPAAARRLAELRKKAPDQFRVEFREVARPEIESIFREYYDTRRQRRNAEFVEWLESNFPKDHETLTNLKDREPSLYARTFESLLEEYGTIFEGYRSSPELGAVLKEDYELKKRRHELCKRLRCEKSEAKRQAIGLELQEVVSRRYDLIVRQKEIAYEQLLRKLEELQSQVHDSRGEIVKYKDPRLKQQNVRHRIRILTQDESQFKWD